MEDGVSDSIQHRHALLLTKANRGLSLLVQVHKPVHSLARAGCVDSLVTVAVDVHFVDSVFEPTAEALGDARLRELREAIDLFYMMLVLDPLLVRALPSGAALSVHKSDALATHVLQRGGPFELQVTLCVKRLDDPALLQSRLCQYFTQALDRECSLDPAFLHVRAEFERELDATKPTWRQCVAANPVVLRVAIETPEALNALSCEAEDYLRQLVDCITKLEAIPPTHRRDDDDVHSRHLPLVVDRVTLSLRQLPITRQTVQIVKELERMRKGFVVCECVRLEPPMVHCSDEEITEFLHAMAAGSDNVHLVVDTGPYNPPVMDTDGMNYTDLCTMILEGVANCDKVKRINLGGMTQFYKSPPTRSGIYRAMIERLFARYALLDVSFEIALFTPVDAQLLHDECARWRTKHPHGRLRVKNLDLHFYEQESLFVPALLDVLDGIQSLVVSNRRHEYALLPETMIALIMTKFPSLECLDIGQLQLASMDVFLQPGAAKLVELRLYNFQLSDRGSLLRFADALGDPTSQLARFLYSLRLNDSRERGGMFRINGREGEQLIRTLRTNGVMGRFETTVVVTPKGDRRIARHLRRDPRRVVRARQCQAERARRAAFLSVLQAHEPPYRSMALLDGSVLRQIFAFAARVVRRRTIVTIHDAFGAAETYGDGRQDDLDAVDESDEDSGGDDDMEDQSDSADAGGNTNDDDIRGGFNDQEYDYDDC